MTSELTIGIRRGALTEFDPERYRLKDAALDYSIEHAKRIRDWDSLDEAVTEKIAEQHNFVAWWERSVRGRGQPKKNNDRSDIILSEPQARELTGIGSKQKERMAIRLKVPDRYRKFLLGKAYAAAMLESVDARGTQGTGENEWYTPAEYIEAARDVLGEIDLDPATSEDAQSAIGATRYFTKDDDGLSKEWHGRVWLNPPYAQPLITHFVAKMIQEYGSGRVTAAIMLTHNYSDTSWFQDAGSVANAVCFTRGRIRFYQPDGEIASPTQGQTFFYFGDNGPPVLLVGLPAQRTTAARW